MSELAEPCRDCRAPLVPGQRYCLYCGARRPDARLEFMDVLVEDFARPPAAAPAVTTTTTAVSVAREPGVNGWLRQNSPVLAVAGLVLGTLLIGLLIGHWATGGGDTSEPARAAAPQVIRVDAGGTTNAAATTPAADTAAADTSTDKKAKAKSDKPSKTKAEAQDTPAAAPPDAVSADSLGTGEAKEKAIEKAAKNGQPISTGGGNAKLPPTDDKAPAGGTEFETIG